MRSFDTADLFLSHEFNDKAHALLENLDLTLNVSNVFDKDPPFFNQDFGFANGSTLGRLVQFGVRKKL